MANLPPLAAPSSSYILHLSVCVYTALPYPWHMMRRLLIDKSYVVGGESHFVDILIQQIFSPCWKEDADIGFDREIVRPTDCGDNGF